MVHHNYMLLSYLQLPVVLNNVAEAWGTGSVCCLLPGCDMLPAAHCLSHHPCHRSCLHSFHQTVSESNLDMHVNARILTIRQA